MPTVAREGPYRFFFYSNEGTEPAHAHVQQGRRLAKFWLEPVAMASATGYNSRDLARIGVIIKKNRKRFLEAWHGFFGR